MSAKYITIHRTYSISPEARSMRECYLEPYPCAYPVLMGVIHQLNRSIFRTLKLFNVLIIALGIVYFQAMAREWTGNPRTALWMTGVLWILPCFMSHFVWAQSLSIVLFFVAFYALERARRASAWGVIAAVAIGAIALTQPSTAAVFALMALIYWLVNLSYAAFGREKRFPLRPLLLQAAAAVGGLLVAAAFYVPAYLKFGHDGFMFGIGRIHPGAGIGAKVVGTAFGKTYSVWEFIWAPATGKINQPVGVGLALFLVLGAGVVLLAARLRRPKDSRWHVIALAWLVFTVLGIQSNHLPISLFPHRFWVFFAIPVALIAGAFLAFLASALKWKDAALAAGLGLMLGCALVFGGAAEKIYGLPGATVAGPRLGLFITTVLASIAGLALVLLRLFQSSAGGGAAVRIACLVILVLAIVLTSGYAKGRFEGFAQWPCGVRFYQGTETTPDGRHVPTNRELMGYIEIHRKFPPNTRLLATTGSERHMIGFDMYAPPYDVDVRRFRKELNETPVHEIGRAWLQRMRAIAREKDLHYVLLDHYQAGVAQFAANRLSRGLRQRQRQAGISDERLSELLLSAAEPTAEEEPFMDGLRQHYEGRQRHIAKEQEALARVRRLRELMRASPDFRLVLDSGPTGVAVFQLKKRATSALP